MLSDTQGLDWSQYLKRVLDSVRRNWIAILPESARMGDKGIVVIQFKIGRDGTVPNPDPRLMRTSGKEPLDRAAMSSIRASSPFEPLPTQYTLPEIELRFIFLYNLPLDYYQ
jgi:TonB family protein